MAKVIAVLGSTGTQGGGLCRAILADKSYLQEIVVGSSGALELTGPELEIGGGVGAGLRQADTDLIAKFDEALTAMKADGTLDAMITLYFPEREGGK